MFMFFLLFVQICNASFNIINSGKYHYYNFIPTVENILKSSNIDDSIYVFGLLTEKKKIPENNHLNEQLLCLSKKYKTSICIIYNKCNLYDDFRDKYENILNLLKCEKIENLNSNDVFTIIVDQKM